MTNNQAERLTELTPEIHACIVEYVRAGNFFSTACRMVGINQSTGYSWLVRGRSLAETPSKIYQNFARDIEAAELVAEKAALKSIIEVGKGIKFTKKSKTITKPDGTKVEEVERELVRDWKACAWLLVQ